jgi:hypothetical protein
MISGGNRCGHDPRHPKLDLKLTGTRGKPFPWLIRKFLERVEGIFRDRAWFPELGPRKKSERLEAMVLVAKAIGRNLDRLTLRAGRPNGDGTFTGITMRTMAGWAQISEQRAFRAFWDLRDAGWMTSVQPIEERPDGARRGLAAIRRPTVAFFRRLGLDQRLRRERKKLWEEQRAQTLVQTIAARRALRRGIRVSRRAADLAARAARQLADGTSPPAAPPPPRPPQLPPADLVARVGAEMPPGTSLADVIDEAKRRQT